MIELENINLTFDDKIIFKDFCLTVGEKEKVYLSAPSGYGKTCLINMLMGFLKPDGGKIKIEGKELGKSTVHEIRQRICYIGQETSLQNGLIKDILTEIGSYKKNRDCDFGEERIKKLFSQFGLSGQALQKEVYSLSGGERQRLAFIICIMLDRDIWLLDEITSGLDAKRRKYIMDYIVNSSKTAIVISHDPQWKQYDKVREVSW